MAFASATITASSAAATAAVLCRRVRGTGSGRLGHGLSGRFRHDQRRISCERKLLRGRLFWGSFRGRLRRNVRRGVRGGLRKFGTEPDGGFLGFGFPIGAAEAFRSGEIPFGGVGILTGGFEDASQLKSHHRVTGFFVQAGELADGILAGASATNASSDLLPISHRLEAL